MKMNKKALKAFLNISIVSLIALSSASFATEYIHGVTPSISGDGGNVKAITMSIISLMRWVGYACALGMIMIIGIKYVIASADEKASLKGMLLKVVIGSIILVLAVEITNIVITVMSSS